MIEYLRHLHDEPSTRFALLLVGGEGCWEVLSREPMLRSRIYRRVRFGAMSAQTVLAVILAPADWTTLRALANAGLDELCLVIHEPHVCDAHHATLRGAFSTTTDAEHLPGYLSDRAPTQTVAEDRGPHPPVPRASFPAFLTRCTELLEHDDLRHVAQTYEDSRHSASAESGDPHGDRLQQQ